MINITKKKECNGCCACVDVCPTKAIRLKTDFEGFWYPEVIKDLCTDCSLCDKTCPELYATELKKNDFEKPICYAAIHKNLEIRFDSTSGGLFSALAEIMYKEGGHVAGAVYNEDFSVRHIVSNEKKELEKLRSSKYLQSDASGLYKEVEKLVIAGEKVLVCGTPCQMAGLRRLLNKDYEHLIIVDFVCRGVNSPKIFLKYIDSIERRVGSKVIAIKAKSKELGWRNLTWKFSFANGNNLFETKHNNLFTRGYLITNAYCRQSCYSCQFKGFPRIADITLADFWGIENVDKTLDNDLGTSMVLLNSKKGLAYFELIKEKIQCNEVKFESILPGNPVLITPLGPPTVDRELFFKDINTATFDEVASKYFPFSKPTTKQKIGVILKSIRITIATTQLHPKSLFKFFKYNFFYRNIHTNWKNGGLFIPAPFTVIEIKKGAQVNFNGLFRFGIKKFKKSKLESRLLIETGGSLEVNGNFTFGYGSDVEVFNGGKLIIKGDNGGSNIGTTIICGEKIVIGNGVQIGRNVTIRDNNGGHYIARQGYKDTRPVIICDRVWLCESCTIMPGVKIGEGAIVGAHSLVISNVPAHAIVTGNPARVVDEDVLWKY
jgi:acetyltransferase-like isoleucine patch superfamily enzyme/coenzyme F420-reducing hydrogenase beta subunit